MSLSWLAVGRSVSTKDTLRFLPQQTPDTAGGMEGSVLREPYKLSMGWVLPSVPRFGVVSETWSKKALSVRGNEDDHCDGDGDLLLS